MGWLQGEQPVRDRVEELLPGRPVMSWVNLGEVLYVLHRRFGADEAETVLAGLRTRLVLEVPTSPRILQAARLKARHRLAYADAFAVATAIARDAVLVTGDPEILSADAGWPVEDVRPASRR